MSHKTEPADRKEQLTLAAMLTFCGKDTQRIAEKLAPAVVARLYNKIPKGLTPKMQATFFECEISQQWVTLSKDLPGERCPKCLF